MLVVVDTQTVGNRPKNTRSAGRVDYDAFLRQVLRRSTPLHGITCGTTKSMVSNRFAGAADWRGRGDDASIAIQMAQRRLHCSDAESGAHRWRRRGGTIGLFIAWTLLFRPLVRPLTDRKFVSTPQRIKRGRYLVESMTACIKCHSPNDMLKTAKGTEGSALVLPMPKRNPLQHKIVAPNITSDLETGRPLERR